MKIKNNLFRQIDKLVDEPPGTIKYTGSHTDVDIHIEVIEYDLNDAKKYTLKNIELFSDPKKTYWINVIGLYNPHIISKVGELYNIHSMDLEDIVHVSKWSKISKNDDYTFATLKMMYTEKEKIISEHFSMILKENVLLTFQETPLDVFDNVRDRIFKKAGRIRQMNTNYLFYALLDSIVDEYFKISGQIPVEFTEIEMKVVDDNIQSIEEIYNLRKEIISLINAIEPLRNSFKTFALNIKKNDDSEISPFYHDLIEHLDQIYELLRTYREMIIGLYEVQMSNQSNNMNKVMMTLTTFSVIFIPLSFLAGVFGMNFEVMPGLQNQYAFIYFVVFCILIAGGMLAFFKIKKW